MTKVNRYTIIFSEKFEKLLEEIAKGEAISKAEAIRRSVAIYGYLSREVAKGNAKLQIVNEEDDWIKEIVLPASLTGATRQRTARSQKPKSTNRTSSQNNDSSEEITHMAMSTSDISV